MVPWQHARGRGRGGGGGVCEPPRRRLAPSAPRRGGAAQPYEARPSRIPPSNPLLQPAVTGHNRRDVCLYDRTSRGQCLSFACVAMYRNPACCERACAYVYARIGLSMLMFTRALPPMGSSEREISDARLSRGRGDLYRSATGGRDLTRLAPAPRLLGRHFSTCPPARATYLLETSSPTFSILIQPRDGLTIRCCQPTRRCRR